MKINNDQAMFWTVATALAGMVIGAVIRHLRYRKLAKYHENKSYIGGGYTSENVPYRETDLVPREERLKDAGYPRAPDPLPLPDKPELSKLWFESVEEEFTKDPDHVSDEEVDRLVRYHCKADSNELVNVTELKHLGMLRQGVKPLSEERCETTNKVLAEVANWAEQTKYVYEWQRRR